MTGAPRNRPLPPVEILLVEDSPGDVRLTQEGLRDSAVENTLHVVNDGEAALDFLRERRDGNQPLPDLILLDLNLPRMDGREVLASIKGDPALAMIPVVVLTTSNAEQDIRQAYALQANCYITKPTGFDGFVAAIEAIEMFWLSIAQLPRRACQEAMG